MRWLLAMLLVGCAASSRTATVSSASVRHDDATLARSIERSLSKDARISIAAKNVRIATNDGVVMLTGSVASSDDERAIRAVVHRTPGVVATYGRLEISPTRDAEDEESDPNIARLVASAIRDPEVHPSCKHGIVKLDGLVTSDRERQALESEAQWIPGVIAVWNDLDVRPR